MGQFNWRKQYAIKQRYEETIGKDIPHTSGIYLWRRYDTEKGITYFYVGQAKDLNKRRFDYYSIQCGLSYPTRHFEASLKKHKDWKFEIITTCDLSLLNELEQHYITEYLKLPNYVTRNESLTGNDQTKSNAKRIDNMLNKYEKLIIKNLKKLNYHWGNENDPMISIWPKENKQKGTYNKISMNAFLELQNWFINLMKGNKNND